MRCIGPARQEPAELVLGVRIIVCHGVLGSPVFGDFHLGISGASVGLGQGLSALGFQEREPGLSGGGCKLLSASDLRN